MFGYRWQLDALDSVKKTGLTAFSCFSGGGGSSFGYKMSGVDVLGFCESDKFMADSYLNNMSVKYPYNIPIQELLSKQDLPDELFNLDILDGSPPCTNFSNSNTTGKKNVYKKYTEGGIVQKLENLPGLFTSFANRLNPKVIIIENVPQMITDKKFAYSVTYKQIVEPLQKNNYHVASVILDAQYMGIPQRRRRVFIIAWKRSFNFPKLNLFFEKKSIPIKELKNRIEDWNNEPNYVKRVRLKQIEKKNFHNFFNNCVCGEDFPFPTITTLDLLIPKILKKRFTIEALLQGQSFPIDYKFLKNTSRSRKLYIIGMAVPPLMIHQIVEKMKEQWFARAI